MLFYRNDAQGRTSSAHRSSESTKHASVALTKSCPRRDSLYASQTVPACCFVLVAKYNAGCVAPLLSVKLRTPDGSGSGQMTARTSSCLMS